MICFSTFNTQVHETFNFNFGKTNLNFLFVNAWDGVKV